MRSPTCVTPTFCPAKTPSNSDTGRMLGRRQNRESLEHLPAASRATIGRSDSTAMASERPAPDRVELLQGTLDLILLRALATMGPQHAYGLAARLAQVADDPFPLNQGTMYAALVRLEQKGWIRGTWQRSENNREAKYYAITKAGRARARAADRAMAPSGRPRRQAPHERRLAMSEARRFLQRLYNLFRPGSAESQLDREVSAHLIAARGRVHSAGDVGR